MNRTQRLIANVKVGSGHVLRESTVVRMLQSIGVARPHDLLRYDEIDLPKAGLSLREGEKGLWTVTPLARWSHAHEGAVAAGVRR